MSKGKHFELTPLGLLYGIESHKRAYPIQVLEELFTYGQKIGKNAIRFTKTGEAKFVRIHKVK